MNLFFKYILYIFENSVAIEFQYLKEIKKKNLINLKKLL